MGANIMSRREYRAITLPEGLYRDIQKYLEASQGRYVSISEIVREAIREFLIKSQDK
jgi:Arc/MetJ-type ribon-helix-helix transcriptional regulator